MCKVEKPYLNFTQRNEPLWLDKRKLKNNQILRWYKMTKYLQFDQIGEFKNFEGQIGVWQTKVEGGQRFMSLVYVGWDRPEMEWERASMLWLKA